MKKSLIIAFICLFSAAFFILEAAVIMGSKHDLSVTNAYEGTRISLGGDTSTEICVFCHTPHSSSNTVNAPIWNRNVTDDTVFQMYAGADAVPNPASLACLSCHDGVLNEGDVSAVNSYDGHNNINPPNGNLQDPNCIACHDLESGSLYPSQLWRIGPILTNDHPVSITYPGANADFLDIPNPATNPNVRLFNNKVECASCHNVHDKDNFPFLRSSNDGSALCKSCHIR